MDPTQLGPAALAALATGAGAPVWAAAIMFIIETLKGIPQIAPLLHTREQLASFVLAAVLVVASYFVALSLVPPTVELSVGGVILAIMSWFTVARLAMALHDDKEQRPGSLRADPTVALVREDEPEGAVIVQ